MKIPIGNYEIDVRVFAAIACTAFIMAFTGGAAVMKVGQAQAAATPADRSDCRRDRGVPMLASDGSVVCIAQASVIWEAARR